MTAERAWPRAQVARIVPGDSPSAKELSALRAEAAALPADAPAQAWSDLAQRARSADPSLARAWAARAVASDRHQAEAQRLLGRELVAGVWLRPHEAAAAQGLVWLDGAWTTWTERERRRLEAAERLERQRAALAAANERAERRRAVSDDGGWYTNDTWLRSPYRPRVVWWGGGYSCSGQGWGNGWGNLWGHGGSFMAVGGGGNSHWRLHLTW
jgi:hypothetical protein